MKGSFFRLIGGAFLISLFVSCGMEVGLGDAIDLTGPEITIDSLECLVKDSATGQTSLQSSSQVEGAFCRKRVTIKGRCSDNIGVERVYVEKKDINNVFQFFQEAKLDGSGEKYVADLNFPQEGTAILRFVAQDKANNSSAKSSRQVTLLVDETAPVGSGWYIDRLVNGIRYSLRDKEYLEGLDFSSLSNKDAAQNVAFTIYGTMSDAMGIKNVSLRIKDENGNEICQIQNTNGTAQEKNHYSPEFKVTHALLTATDNTLERGKHYLKISYDAADVVQNPEPNAVEDAEVELGYFIWWPESDEPHIECDDVKSDGILYLHIGDACKLSIFDDDSLQKAYYAILTDAEYRSLTISSLKTNPSSLENAVASSDRTRRFGKFDHSGDVRNIRDETVSLYAPETPQVMHLVAVVWDNTEKHVSTLKDWPVHVQDETVPDLFISSPQNNTIPTLSACPDDSTAAAFEITGQTFDVGTCEYLEFLYVKDSVSSTTQGKMQAAKAFFDTLTTADHNAAKPSGSTAFKKTLGGVAVGSKNVPSGMVLYSVKLGNATAQGSGNLKSQAFSFTLDLFQDFSGEEKKNKFFEVRLQRGDGNFVYQEYQLLGDDKLPTINCEPKNMESVEFGKQDLTIKFYAAKASGLGMQSQEYKIKKIDGTTETELKNVSGGGTGGYQTSGDDVGKYVWTIPRATLQNWVNASETMPKFKLYAKDLLGNAATDSRTFLLTSWPTLEKISSSNMDATYKVGDKISISATFSDTITITGSPKLKLKFSDGGPIKYATYKSGKETTTLIFEYTVQKGDVSSKLLCFNEANVGPFDTTSGQITQLASTGVHLTTLKQNLQDTKTIALDGVPPKITNIDVKCKEGATEKASGSFSLGNQIRVQVTADKEIQVQGSPELTLKAGSKNVVLSYEKTSNRVVYFTKTIDSSTANGLLSGSYSSITSFITKDSATITDKAGNKIELGSSAPTVSGNITVDTVAPLEPTISIKNSSGGNVSVGSTSASNPYKSQDVLKINVSGKESGGTLEYSVTGGASWATWNQNTDLPSGVSVITARHRDVAGNVSPYSPTIYIDITTAFPDFTVECQNPNGNYAAGRDILFKVIFDRDVNVASNSTAKITISGLNAGDACTNAVANVDASMKGKKLKVVTFTYKVQDPDQFTLKIASGGVSLSGITDLYGNTQGSKSFSKASNVDANGNYTRPSLRCDGIAPKITNMMPNGRKGTTNVFTSGNVITLTFSEKVNKGSGNLILRQIGSGENDTIWAIPPVLSTDDFDAIKSSVSEADAEILVKQEGGSDMVDNIETAGQKTLAPPASYNWEKCYHGTGKPVGPYQKLTHGLKDVAGGDFSPDLTAKYVLAFDFNIYGTTEQVACGKTANTNGTYREITEKVTVNQIRQVFERAHYHERILDVTSPYVVMSNDGKTATVTFQEGPIGGKALPDGRHWILLIDKRAFYDDTGNQFGANSVGVIENENPERIPLGASNSGTTSFWSDKVSAPVIRVERFSYGLGTKMYKSDGTQVVVHHASSGDMITGTPTGYVRVKIESETPGATLKYNSRSSGSKEITKAVAQATSTSDVSLGTATSGVTAPFYYSTIPYLTTGQYNAMIPTTQITQSSKIIYVGDGKVDSARKDYIVASAERTNLTPSEKSIEGAFRTVVKHFDPRKSKSGATIDDFVVLVDGMNGNSGVPYVSGFPLKDSVDNSAYVRRCFKKPGEVTFVWVSYDVLCDSSVNIKIQGHYCINFAPMYCGQITTGYNMWGWGGRGT